MTRALIATTLALVALSGLVYACSAGDASRSRTTGSSASDAASWERVVPGGSCECADGSQFIFWVHKADPKKVVLYLEGGGACFSASTCAPDKNLYKAAIGAEDAPSGQPGVFDLNNERNPFRGYSMVAIPYCTGDAHMGDATTHYAPGLNVHHKGYVNGTATLDGLVATFPHATHVVVMGVSAGAIAAPLYAGLAADRLPKARITVLADGAGAFPDTANTNALIAHAWGTANAIPDWSQNAGLTAGQWTSFVRLFIQSGRHDPNIVFARHDYAYDANQASWYRQIGLTTGDLLSRIEANETRINHAGVNIRGYIAPGDAHTVLSDEAFYTETVNGEPLADWVTDLIAGRPVTDVHCRQCATNR